MDYKSKLQVSYQAADYLVVSIDNWLVYRTQMGREKMTVAELLAPRYLASVRNRLASRSIQTQQKTKVDFSFSFTVQEIFAILTCIAAPADNVFLCKLIGDLHQKSCNYHFLIKNNQII